MTELSALQIETVGPLAWQMGPIHGTVNSVPPGGSTAVPLCRLGARSSGLAASAY